MFDWRLEVLTGMIDWEQADLTGIGPLKGVVVGMLAVAVVVAVAMLLLLMMMMMLLMMI